MSILSVKDLTHSFGGLTAVSGFHMDVAQGELVGLIGPNGAGKTTVFNLISGIYMPKSGSITFGGAELAGLSPDRVTRAGVGRTFQNIRLFGELTVLDNIRAAHYPNVAYNPIEAIFHVGRYRSEERRIIEHSLDLLRFFRMESLAAERARNLPYGYQRRLEIIRALATGPMLLLLDEPAAGMNHREIDELMDFIRWIRGEFKLTVVLIEHQMRLVMNICERLTVLDFGMTIAEGLPEEIRRNPKVLEAYLGEEAHA